jgi:hypothetical protein
MPDTRRITVLAFALALLIALTACTGDDDDIFDPVADPATPAEMTPVADNDATQDSVGLDIIEGPGGSVVVFVPVYIQGEGPFDFVLDTGASRSVIDEAVSAQFDFPEVEDAGDVTGVGGTAMVNLIEVQEWRMGEHITLPESRVTTFPLFEDREAAEIEGQLGREFQGLLGSDILSHFGTVTIDFDEGRLTVGR